MAGGTDTGAARFDTVEMLVDVTSHSTALSRSQPFAIANTVINRAVPIAVYKFTNKQTLRYFLLYTIFLTDIFLSTYIPVWRTFTLTSDIVKDPSPCACRYSRTHTLTEVVENPWMGASPCATEAFCMWWVRTRVVRIVYGLESVDKTNKYNVKRPKKVLAICCFTFSHDPGPHFRLQSEGHPHSQHQQLSFQCRSSSSTCHLCHKVSQYTMNR